MQCLQWPSHPAPLASFPHQYKILQSALNNRPIIRNFQQSFCLFPVAQKSDLASESERDFLPSERKKIGVIPRSVYLEFKTKSQVLPSLARIKSRMETLWYRLTQVHLKNGKNWSSNALTSARCSLKPSFMISAVFNVSSSPCPH